MPGVEWVEPALVWNGRKLHDLHQPRLAEFATDDFLPEFIEAMSAVGKDADPAGYLTEHLLPGDSQPRLFQPLHGRYYLVTGSLVCRQPGLPDKAVDRAGGESMSFVLRRALNGANVKVEQAWINEGPQRGWHPVAPGTALADEERFPLHPLKVCTQSRTSLDNFRPVAVCLQERTLYHGYLPTGNREKYLASDASAMFSDPQDYIAAIESQSALENFRYNEFDTRVVSVWADLEKRKSIIGIDQVHQLSLYLILDLGDYLARALPSVWEAVKAGSPNSVPAASQRRTVYTALATIIIDSNAGNLTLLQALRDRQNDLPLVRGEEIAGGEPQVGYSFFNTPVNPTLNNAVAAALGEESQPFTMPTEMRDILHNLVTPEPADTDTTAETYFIRLSTTTTRTARRSSANRARRSPLPASSTAMHRHGIFGWNCPASTCKICASLSVASACRCRPRCGG